MTKISNDSFLLEKGKQHWRDLTREDLNEYYRRYYADHKEKYTQHARKKHCDVCNKDVNNIYGHRASKRHKDLVRIISQYGPIHGAGEAIPTGDATEQGPADTVPPRGAQLC